MLKCWYFFYDSVVIEVYKIEPQIDSSNVFYYL